MTGTRMSRRCSKKARCAVVADRDVEAGGRVLRVEDSLRALQTIGGVGAADVGGATWSAVTGSAGKTTTKDVIAEMLATEMQDGEDEGQPE